jgi:hypothetical protein
VSVEECGFTTPLVIKVKEEDEDPAFGKFKVLILEVLELQNICFYQTL